MASPSQSPIRERPELRLVPKTRKTKRNDALKRRLITTGAALVLLALALIFLRPQSKRRAAPVAGAASVNATDLRFSNLQISQPTGSEVVYIDGVLTNSGRDPIKGATVEVDFRDWQGNIVATVQRPVVGMAHGGIDVVRNEFVRNPILPTEMRFFRIAVEQAPLNWNHEVPELKIVAVKAG